MQGLWIEGEYLRILRGVSCILNVQFSVYLTSFSEYKTSPPSHGEATRCILASKSNIFLSSFFFLSCCFPTRQTSAWLFIVQNKTVIQIFMWVMKLSWKQKKKKKLERRGGDRLRPLQSCRHYAVMCSVGLSIKIILYSVFTYLCELA